jgi:DivIVA domain-containing protein
MNSALIAETHRFGRVRRNGYDPAEVNAVIARLADALRRNDERITALTVRIDAADASADAIRKTFVAAESTCDEIVEEARAEASTITKAARAEADELAEACERLQSEAAAIRDRILTKVYAEAEDRMVEIERRTAQRSADAEWAVREAMDVRNRTVSDTEADTEAIVHKAEGEAARIRARIATMARAAGVLEKAAKALAATAQEGAKVIDLKALEQLDQSKLAPTSPAGASEPETIIEDKPLLVVAEPTGDTTEEGRMPKTRYKRSTGVPLKERIKIARMSG